MPIDPQSETLLSLTEAAKSLPRRRGGKQPHVSCLYRWTTAGCKGVRLETIQVGGTRCTSREALERFFRRLSLPEQFDQRQQPQPRHPHSRTVAQRRREIAAAERALDAAGI